MTTETWLFHQEYQQAVNGIYRFRLPFWPSFFFSFFSIKFFLSSPRPVYSAAVVKNVLQKGTVWLLGLFITFSAKLKERKNAGKKMGEHKEKSIRKVITFLPSLPLTLS